MPATKKATKKTVAKKTVGKKSAASAPIVKTQIIKNAKSGDKGGQFVSKEYAKTHPNTTMAMKVERPLAGAAKKAADKSSAKKSHAPAKKATASAKKTAAPAKKAVAAKSHTATKHSAPAKKASAKPSAVRTANKALDNVSKVAKQASKALASPSATTATIEREAAKLGTAVGKAIVQTAHAAESKTERGNSSKRTAPAVTASQQLRETPGFRTIANPPVTSAPKGKGPFHPENVPAAIESTRVADLQRPLLKQAGQMFS